MDKLRFGTAGIPLSSKPYNTVSGISKVRELGLNAMELEFVRNINVSADAAPEVRKAAKQNDVVLSCHASYFINLSSSEREKRAASAKRIIDAALRAHECGAFSVCFHAGFYQKENPQKVYETIKSELAAVIDTLKKRGISIWIRPETTGKGSQFGSLDEIIALSKELENIMPCVDFSHMHARSAGKLNSYEEFCACLERIEKELGKKALQEMHIHVSGIEYSAKGELYHLNLKDSDFKYRELLRALKEFECKGVVISESPNIEQDAMLMKKVYEEL